LPALRLLPPVDPERVLVGAYMPMNGHERKPARSFIAQQVADS